MSTTRTAHSLADFLENTPDYLQKLKESGKPMVLTVDGKPGVVVQDAASYQKLLDIIERARVIEGIQRGLDDMNAGRMIPHEEFFAGIRRELGLPLEK